VHWFLSLFKLFLSLITSFKEFSNVPNKDAEALTIHAPAINTLVTTESTIDKGVVNEDQIKCDGLASYFEYISTMSSFNDPVFKIITGYLLKDRHASWSAFKSLSSESV
jgi:hypothetical protein